MRVGQTSFITFSSKLLSSAIGFAGTIYFANLLGPEILGDYYLVLSIVAWLSLLGTMGVSTGIKKRMSEGDEAAEYRTAGGVIIVSLMLILLVGILVFQREIRRQFGIQSIEFVVLLLVVGLLSSYVSAMLEGSHLVHISSLLKPVRNTTRTVLQILGVVLNFGLVALFWGYAAGSVVLIVIGLIVLGRPYSMPDRSHFRSVIDYSKYAWLGSLEGKTFNQADIIILGLFAPKSIVGVYGITWSIASFLIVFSSSITSTVFPEMSRLSNNDDFSQVAVLLEDSLSYAGLITIPGLIGGFLLSDRILRIYGEGFGRGAEVLFLLICAVLFYGYQKQFAATLGGMDRPREAMKINGILIGSNIILNVVLISSLGIMGAALASVSSAVLGTGTGYLVARQYIPVHLPVGRIASQLGAAMVMGTIVLLIEAGMTIAPMEPPNWLVTVFLVLLGGGTYFGALVLFSESFRATISENLPWGFPWGISFM